VPHLGTLFQPWQELHPQMRRTRTAASLLQRSSQRLLQMLQLPA